MDQPNISQLSVIIPTYNRRDSLLRTLAALAAQTFPAENFEVIVVSDGSSDGSAEAVRGLSLPYRIRFIEQKNQGPSAARNNGARAAASPLLIFVDDDIEPIPEFVQEHFAAHQNEERLVLIGPQSGPINEPMPNWIAWEHRMLQKQYDNFCSGVWEAGPNNLYSGNFSLRREHLLSVGGFNEQFTRQEDVELGFRLEAYGVTFQFNRRADGIHRPTRTFASWYKTPYEYGRRDIQIAREGGEAQAIDLARKHFRSRNILTRVVARACIGAPVLEGMALGAGRAAVHLGAGKIAQTGCSLLFNLRYLQGMCAEVGGRRKLWQALDLPVETPLKRP